MSKTKLGKILTFQRGYDLTKTQMLGGTVPVVGSSQIIGWHNVVKSKGPNLLIGRSGTVGRPQYYEIDIWPHNTTLFVSDFHGNNPKFAYYFLKNLKLEEFANSSSVPTLNRNFIHPILVSLPVIEEQNKIEEILTKLDNKIEINNKINSELESLAKTIYDYWFVQFDFPDENGNPYKTSGGKMVWNDELKRDIPEGWEIKRIEDFCKIFTGKKDVNQAVEVGKYKFYSCAPDYKYSNDLLYEGKAILVSGNGSYTGRTIFVNEPFDLYQRTYACVNKSEIDILAYIFYSMLRFLSLKVSGGTHGSAIPYIVFDDIARESLAIDLKTIYEFQAVVYPILNQIKSIDEQNHQLVVLRDWLLPMLMNGQIVISNKQ